MLPHFAAHQQNSALLTLAWESQSVRSICEDENHAQRELGAKVAEKLKHRLADLSSATSVRDLLVGRPRIADAEHGRQMLVDLADGYEMLFEVNHPKPPVYAMGGIDWSRVTRVKIMDIRRNSQ
jgi:toxin HigB-1